MIKRTDLVPCIAHLPPYSSSIPCLISWLSKTRKLIVIKKYLTKCHTLNNLTMEFLLWTLNTAFIIMPIHHLHPQELWYLKATTISYKMSWPAQLLISILSAWNAFRIIDKDYPWSIPYIDNLIWNPQYNNQYRWFHHICSQPFKYIHSCFSWGKLELPPFHLHCLFWFDVIYWWNMGVYKCLLVHYYYTETEDINYVDKMYAYVVHCNNCHSSMLRNIT